jgi:alkylation response protein AidB-like acyl-CoA dehydrogenase
VTAAGGTLADVQLPVLLGAAFPRASFVEEEVRALVELQRALDEDIGPQAEENDARGRYPSAAVAALKRCGILKIAVPRGLGGIGASHRASLEAQVRIAAADPAIAQIFKIHDELTREIFVYCPPKLRPRLAQLILEENFILGLAVAENGRTADAPFTTIATPQPDGSFVVDGQKIYTTGAAEADLVAVWAFDPVAGATQPLLGFQLNLIPPDTPGVTIHRDWDNLGQRATDSGTITFAGVRTDPHLKGSLPGKAPLSQSPVRYQAGFAAVLVGVGVGALRAAVPFVREHSRPWGTAGVERAVDDPLIRRLAGELTADLAAAYTLTLACGDVLDAFERGELTRAELAVPIYAAKSVATRAGLRAANEIYQLMGTRATRRTYGFDRYWRNARTLSLHDPVDWKNAEIGAHVLAGWETTPGVFT